MSKLQKLEAPLTIKDRSSHPFKPSKTPLSPKFFMEGTLSSEQLKPAFRDRQSTIKAPTSQPKILQGQPEVVVIDKSEQPSNQ